ncbi:hypothetical protein JZU56_04280, partial [bacterium]|nr:hypothetical protein [bacterium]
SGSTVYAGGSFSTIGGTTRNCLAAIGTNGTLASWNPNANNQVLALAISDSTVYAGGDFTSIGGTTRNYLAAIGTDSTLASWDPNPSSWVNALAISGSTVYAGGTFLTIGGTTRNRLAAIGTEGTLTSWNPNANNNVSALAISGSTVYAGGQFTNLCASPSTCTGQIVSPATNVIRNRLAAIGTDGTLSTTWNPNASNPVSALAISGSTVYAGGSFVNLCTAPSSCTTQASTTRNRLAAIGTDGTLSNTWNPNASGAVNALAISGSTVYAGGGFLNLCTAPSSCTDQIVSGTNVIRNRLAAIGTDGTLSNTWNPNANNLVSVLAISGSTVYVGGSFVNLCTSPSS